MHWFAAVPCEACGNLTAFDFADACGTVIDAAGARVSTRLFQMHLYLANIYRNVSRSNSMIESIEEDVQ